MANKRIYMDNAASTKMKPEVFEAMKPYNVQTYGNPSSIHWFGRQSRAAVNRASENVASIFSVEPEEIVFTSGGSEANNLALFGSALAKRDKGRHIITSSIEHHAVFDTCKFLEKYGFEVTYLPADSGGIVNPEDLAKAITGDTILVSIMHANNEMGAIQPVEELALVARENQVLFHTDAVQTIGNIPVNIKELNVDLLSLSAHKFYGPKGVGALYVKKGVKLVPHIHGGAQERDRRAGTENVAGIIGLSKGLELAVEGMDDEVTRIEKLRDNLIEGVMESIEDVKLNGHPNERLPGNVNFSFAYVEGESILLNLDMAGIAASSGSACTSGSLEPSHVLTSMGLSHEQAHGSVRFSLGHYNTQEDNDYLLQVLPGIIKRLRDMSPLIERR